MPMTPQAATPATAASARNGGDSTPEARTGVSTRNLDDRTPETPAAASARNVGDRIEELRARFGADLTVVGHHYQADEVIAHCDLRGDSLELARRCAALETRHIMFCGVYFMAESAALLAGKNVRVHLPEPSAECSMALMSPAGLLREVMKKLTRNGRKVIPLAYVNSTLGVKAAAGELGGAVCTSANAATMLEWALREGDAVLFLPDKNLGFNTAAALGLAGQDLHTARIVRGAKDLDTTAADKARLILWPGFCSIHTRFNPRQMERLRAEHPGASIVVHPECIPAVAAAADAVGSTAFIIRNVNEAPDDTVLGIGTEINLVERLARQHAARLTVLPLVESACTHMAQTTEESLCTALEALGRAEDSGEESPYRVRIGHELQAHARAALERMLEHCA
ncbi:MAG: quinolinate synthase NadA [Desulfovibrio sp.]|jgi:quinolinate synthase|nr:quinolinate synthase NadA [Desulfovibrio sp.]